MSWHGLFAFLLIACEGALLFVTWHAVLGPAMACLLAAAACFPLVGGRPHRWRTSRERKVILGLVLAAVFTVRWRLFPHLTRMPLWLEP
ncbi:MAG: hypothetical protein JXR94_16095, partial [Candidatus Hydrogenedentes bacterium]|nr:hypothetical protein [Candidatus Hydrogenedentota bacterium]